MGRVKVAMEPMKDRKKRNKTFHSRKESMIKKALELTTLCDVNVSMIIYDHPHDTPQIVPPDLHKFNSSVNLYQNYRSTGRGKIKSYDLSGFFMDRKVKIEELLKKAKKKNLETKYPTWFHFLDDFSHKSLSDFASGLGNKIDDVKNRIESLKKTSKIPNVDENRGPIMTTSPIDCNNYGLFLPVGFIGNNEYQNNAMNLQHSSNPNLVNTNMMMNMPMSDYYNECPMMPMNVDISKFDMEELLNPSSMMEMLMSEDDNFNFQIPLPEFCFQSEILQQQSEKPSCYNSNKFLMSEFGSTGDGSIVQEQFKWYTDYDSSWFN